MCRYNDESSFCQFEGGTNFQNAVIVCTLTLTLAPVIRVRARASIWEFNFRKWYKLLLAQYEGCPEFLYFRHFTL